PTLWWLITAPFRWLGRNRRRIWGLVSVLLVLIAGPPLWWSFQLAGLPDIGEPFDFLAFRSLTIPDDRNAFVLYRPAAARLKPVNQSGPSKDKSVDFRARWSKADPEVRRWAEENHEVLTLYRQGAERPDALDSSVASNPGESVTLNQDLDSFQRLALLEASRL